MSKNQGIYIMITTCGTREDAYRLARLVVERRLAACSQVSGPITSFYWWEGKLEEDQEFQVKFKLPASLCQKTEDFIREVHPYELPQIIALQADKTLVEYERWVVAETDG